MLTKKVKDKAQESNAVKTLLEKAAATSNPDNR
jgi:hypothetical protein